MLETMIAPLPPKGIEPDYPYEGNTMFRVVKEPVAMEMTYVFNGSTFTIHYGDQNAVSSRTLVATELGSTISIPANVTEFFLKQVKPDVKLNAIRVSGPNITEITWNPELKTNLLQFYGSSKLVKVSPYIYEGIESLNFILQACPLFNGDISAWKTDNVTNMSYAFYGCAAFNQDISGWDTSKVTTMNYMFRDCVTFNQDISSWDTSKVTIMNSMFRNTSSFNQDLSGWNVSKVTNRSSFDTGATAWQANYKPLFST